MLKNLPANAVEIRDTSSIPGSRRSPGEGHGNPLQYSCPENPMDRGAWQAIVPWNHEASAMIVTDFIFLGSKIIVDGDRQKKL